VNPPLRLAVVGTLHPHSALFQELLPHVPGIEVVAIVHDGGTIASGMRRLPAYDRLEDLLSKEVFDAALLTVPNDKGAEAACALAGAGKHILADKPVCRSAKEMYEVVEAVRKANVKFAVAYQRRFHPAHRRARRMARGGGLGALFNVQAHLITTDIPSRGPGHYLFKKERSGGGILHWLGCHVIDLVRDLAGCEFADVVGTVGRVSGAPVDVEEVASVAFRLENGAAGSITVGYAIPFASDSPYKESPKDSRIAAWGGRAMVAYEPFGDRIELRRFAPEDGAPLVEAHDAYPLPLVPGYEGWLGRSVVADFVESVAHDRPPSVTALDNLRVLEVIEAVYGRSELRRREYSP